MPTPAAPTDAEILAEWRLAAFKTARGQSVRMGDRMLTQADGAEIRAQIEYWSGKIAAANRVGPATLVADFSRGLRA